MLRDDLEPSHLISGTSIEIICRAGGVGVGPLEVTWVSWRDDLVSEPDHLKLSRLPLPNAARRSTSGRDVAGGNPTSAERKNPTMPGLNPTNARRSNSREKHKMVRHDVM
jgi:hypothetical protein